MTNEILIEEQYARLKANIKGLNKIFDTYNINAYNRVFFASGMLLALYGQEGLKPEDLTGEYEDEKRDSIKIYQAISNILDTKKDMTDEQKTTILGVYKVIKADPELDLASDKKGRSVTAQIFDFVYENIR